MKARVIVTLRKSVLDPQGQTIQGALESLGFNQVDSIRCGKMMEVNFKEGTPADAAEKDLKQMCEKLLANTVIEDYRWEFMK